MQKHKFIIGIFNTLTAFALICGLSACVIQNPLGTKIQSKTASKNIVIEKAGATTMPDAPAPNSPAQPALSPLALHQSLQPNLTNQECPTTQDDSSYRLGAEDEITIKVFGENDLSGDYTIQNSGTVAIPLIGETTLSGCTLRQAEQLLFIKFTDGYLVNPSIALAISKHRPFYILGEIREPGRYDYVVGMNTLKAVALAGGFTYRANKKKAKILKGHSNNKPVYEDLMIEKEIHPGDVIFIKERFF